MHYLFGFSGRINRAKLWLFILIALAVEAGMFVIAAYGLTWTGFWQALMAQMQPHKGELDWFALPWPKVTTPLEWGSVIVLALLYLVMLWAGFAITIKRLHDRAKSAWWLLLYWGAPMLFAAGQYCPRYQAFVVSNPHDMRLVWGILGLSLAILALDIWVFIDLYCLRGTKGENKYGPDPLARLDAA